MKNMLKIINKEKKRKEKKRKPKNIWIRSPF